MQLAKYTSASCMTLFNQWTTQQNLCVLILKLFSVDVNVHWPPSVVVWHESDMIKRTKHHVSPIATTLFVARWTSAQCLTQHNATSHMVAHH